MKYIKAMTYFVMAFSRRRKGDMNNTLAINVKSEGKKSREDDVAEEFCPWLSQAYNKNIRSASDRSNDRNSPQEIEINPKYLKIIDSVIFRHILNIKRT